MNERCHLLLSRALPYSIWEKGEMLDLQAACARARS